MIVVIDDKKIFLDDWQEVLSKEGSAFRLFCHPLEFLSFCDKNNAFVSKIEFLVVDQKTPGFDVLEADFLTAFHDKYPNFAGHSLLCTSLHPPSKNIEGYGYTASIPKKACNRSKLTEYCRISVTCSHFG